MATTVLATLRRWLGLGAAPTVSAAATADVYYDTVANALKVSFNGAAYTLLVPAALPPNGTAGGDLGGTFPNPTVTALTTTTGPTSLVVGAVADGQLLKRAGATLVGDTGEPLGGFQFVEDFLGALSGAFVGTAYSYTTQNWVGTTPNTGTMVAGVGSATEIGVITQSTGTNTAGAHFVTAWQSGPKGVAFVHSSAHAFEYGFKVASSTAVSDGTNTYACNVGVNNASAYAATLGVGFYVRWDANANTHFLFCTADGAGETVVSTTTVVAGTGYHKIVFTKAAGSTAVHCLIDGVDVGSTGTLPTSAAIGPGMVVVKTAGTTARTLDTDWVYADYQIPGGR